MESLQNAQNKANEIALKEADLYRFQAGTTSEEFRTRMTVEEANRRNALLAQQGQDQKIQGALTANLRNKETIEKNIYDDFEKDQRVKAYRAIQMTGKIPPDIQSGYDKAVSERNSLINARTRNINATINRLETQLYGAPVGAAATNAITMDDVRTTAAKSGKTVQQVIEQAKAKGYSITGQ
jgi:hypothetical protein